MGAVKPCNVDLIFGLRKGFSGDVAYKLKPYRLVGVYQITEV